MRCKNRHARISSALYACGTATTTPAIRPIVRCGSVDPGLQFKHKSAGAVYLSAGSIENVCIGARTRRRPVSSGSRVRSVFGARVALAVLERNGNVNGRMRPAPVHRGLHRALPNFCPAPLPPIPGPSPHRQQRPAFLNQALFDLGSATSCARLGNQGDLRTSPRRSATILAAAEHRRARRLLGAFRS